MLLNRKPTKENPLRVILNTDANNEIDDQMAIVHALLSPELNVEGIIAAHYGQERDKDSMERSYQEILHLLDLLDMRDEVPVYRGAEKAMVDHQTPQRSEGADFIIERALINSDENLHVAYLGPLTDMASAYLINPEIAKSTVTLWIGGGWWPTGGREFNASNDWISVDLMFRSEMPLIQFSRSTYRMMRVGVAEMEKYIMGKGAVGDYLTAIFKEWRIDSPYPRKWRVYGDSPAIGVMINPDWGFYRQVAAPGFNKDLTYDHKRASEDNKIELCLEVTAGDIFEDFYKKLDKFSNRL